MDTSRSPSAGALILLLLAFAAAWFGTLGSDRRLLNPDEGRYAEIPREMVATGDWLTPRLNDLKYFEKPALQYWTTAVAYEIFGVNEFASRLWCGLTGFLGIVLTGWLSTQLFGRVSGLIAAMLLASSLMYVVLGHLNTLDMGLAFFMHLMLCGFMLAQKAPEKSPTERNFMLLAWAAVAFAVLSKGIVAMVLPSFTLVTYSLVTRDFSPWRRLHILLGLPLFLIITAPWFIAVSLANPEFAEFFFLHEHFQRFLTDVHRRVEPWWYFIPLLIAGALPWIGLAVHGIKNQWQADRANVEPGSSPQAFAPRRFLLIWVVCVVFFFSLSHSKLAPYIVPVMPALAMLAGDFVSRMDANAFRKHLLAMAAFWAILLGYLAFAPIPHKRGIPDEVLGEVFRHAAMAPAIALLGTIAAVAMLRKTGRLIAVSLLSMGTFAALSILLIQFDVARQVRSGFDLAQVIKPHLRDNSPLYSVWHYDHSLSFYLERPMTLVDYAGELEFGQAQEPGKSFPKMADWVSTWQSSPAGAIAVFKQDAYAEAQRRGLVMREIGRTFELIAVIKPAENP